MTQQRDQLEARLADTLSQVYSPCAGRDAVLMAAALVAHGWTDDPDTAIRERVRLLGREIETLADELAVSTDKQAALLRALRVSERTPTPVMHDQDGWWFWNETWADKIGPFPNEANCRAELARYCREVLGDG